MRSSLLFGVALAIGLVSGCNDDGGAAKPSGSGGGSTAMASTTTTSGAAGVGGAGGAGGGGLPERIVADATEGELSLPFRVTIDGQGSGFLGAIHLAPSGTIALGGETFAAVTYEKQPFFQYTLYQTMAVRGDRLFLVWTYCEMGEVIGAYYEGTDGTALTYEPGSGTCSDELDAPSIEAVSLPAIDMPLPQLIDGYFADGPNVHLEGATPGWVRLGEELVVLPFEEVDCSACGDPGWRELHTLLWSPEAARVCFAIFYFSSEGDPLVVAYSLTLPDLSDPAGDMELSAEWTAPP